MIRPWLLPLLLGLALPAAAADPCQKVKAWKHPVLGPVEGFEIGGWVARAQVVGPKKDKTSYRFAVDASVIFAEPLDYVFFRTWIVRRKSDPPLSAGQVFPAGTPVVLTLADGRTITLTTIRDEPVATTVDGAPVEEARLPVGLDATAREVLAAVESTALRLPVPHFEPFDTTWEFENGKRIQGAVQCINQRRAGR